jgi:hypothetical protein
VDVGASFSIFHHWSSSMASGPGLFGPDGRLIACWGSVFFTFDSRGKFFVAILAGWCRFPHLGGELLEEHNLLVDPANCSLIDSQGKFFSTLACASPPTASAVTGLHSLGSSPPSLPAPSPPASVTSTPSLAANYKRLLDEFLDVVNMSKLLPPVSHQVVQHIVTAGLTIVAKFCRLDGEKLEFIPLINLADFSTNIFTD